MNLTPCTLIVLRHAEKSLGSDPELTDEGRQRSRDLAHLLKGVNIQKMYCTEYIRTRQTLEPLSAIAATPIETIPAENAPRWRAAISDIEAGETVVICGHQNTVPLFVEEVGGKVSELENVSGQSWIPGHIFDRLYVATWQHGKHSEFGQTKVLELRYGTRCEQ